MTRNYSEEDSVKKGLASLAVALGASEGDVAQIDADGNVTLAPVSGGSSSLPSLILHDPTGGDTITPGSNYLAPFNTWTVLRDDLDALQQDEFHVILPSGIYLAGGVIDTANNWTIASGNFYMGPVGDDATLMANVPWPGVFSMPQADIACFRTAPMLLVSDGTSGLLLKAHNATNTNADLSGEALWAIKVADIPA